MRKLLRERLAGAMFVHSCCQGGQVSRTAASLRRTGHSRAAPGSRTLPTGETASGSTRAGRRYGAGLHLLECLRLRVKDMDFEAHQIVVREGKGDTGRVAMLPALVRGPLAAHLGRVRTRHQHDLERGGGRVSMPDALQRKDPNAEREWGWQWMFPAARVRVDPRSGQRRRPHMDESVLQRALKEATRQAGLGKPVSCHTLRHNVEYRIMPSSFAKRGESLAW